VISNTGCPIFQLGTPPGIPDASKAIPFLGLLIGWATVRHRVSVFEGHPSALAAGEVSLPTCRLHQGTRLSSATNHVAATTSQ
jgi:hypothetical protein